MSDEQPQAEVPAQALVEAVQTRPTPARQPDPRLSNPQEKTRPKPEIRSK